MAGEKASERAKTDGRHNLLAICCYLKRTKQASSCYRAHKYCLCLWLCFVAQLMAQRIEKIAPQCQFALSLAHQ